MPFTPAHPAAILLFPRLLRKWTVPSALVIGSMAPDFAYFLPLGVQRIESHSLGGLFWFCLPIGWGAYLIFHLFLKRPIHSLLPAFIARRLNQVIGATRLPKVSWLAVTVSLLAGAITHLAWDAFTHNGAPGVEAIPLLRTDLFAVGTYHVYAYRVVQYFSSAIGLLILGLWTFQWLRKTATGPEPAAPLTPPQRVAVFASLFGVPAIGGLWSASPHLLFPLTGRSLELAAGSAVVTVFESFGLILLAFGLWWHLQMRRSK
jgi:hypothetical protein